MVGSKPLPFNSVTIKHVKNNTYEPKLEESMHNALSKEFISQGIRVMTDGGEAVLETTISQFELSAIASLDDIVQEQVITMFVDTKIKYEDREIEFPSLQSPIRITFHTTGSVSETVSEKQRAIEKASSEIAREIISKIIIRYAE